MATAKQLDDIIECLICTEVYTDPRVLPCVHTYCLKCIEAWSKDRQPGDKLACPLCRKEYTLPSNGVSDLPKNFFVNNFLQMKKLSSVESRTSPCEACGGDEVMNVASVYCVECRMKFCCQCERAHKAIKLTSSHRLILIGEEMNEEAFLQSMPPTSCDQYKYENLKIYCCDCKSVICMMCYIELHNGHKCADITKVEDEFRQRMESDADNVAAGVEKCREMLQKLEKEKMDFNEQIIKAGIEIGKKAEELKQMIDNHKEKLMGELSSMKQKRMKEIESLREDIERQLMSLESYKKYVDEVRQKGTACDVARASSDLHERADELLRFDVIERMVDDLGHADVTITSSVGVMGEVRKTLGHLKLTAVKTGGMYGTPTVTRVIPHQRRVGVYAVAVVGDDVFVARANSQQVEVYDAMSLTLQRHINITVPETYSSMTGLAGCAINHCLYMSVSLLWRSEIHRVDLSVGSGDAVKTWSMSGRLSGLSVNRSHNVVVACHRKNKLLEYTTHGSLVREIRLQAAGVTGPRHAIQLSSGDYVVTTSGDVIVIGVNGQVLHSYGQSPTTGSVQIKDPRCLAVTKNDKILVVDQSKNRILSLNSSLGSVQELPLSADGGIQGPYSLCLDEPRDRLYVGESGGAHRVMVFDGVKF